jgi:hypothetical protein
MEESTTCAIDSPTGWPLNPQRKGIPHEIHYRPQTYLIARIATLLVRQILFNGRPARVRRLLLERVEPRLRGFQAREVTTSVIGARQGVGPLHLRRAQRHKIAVGNLEIGEKHVLIAGALI